ncbi:MAG: CapA family protein [Clostridia bacterium]|nr:CapA family protein [Clostridia bacterium]
MKKHSKKNKPNIILLMLLVILLIIAAFVAFGNNKNVEQKNQETALQNTEEQEEPKKDVSFSITALGDVLCHNTQYWDAYVKSTDTYDFSYVFENVKEYTKAGDVTIANLETSFADAPYSNYPTFNSPASLATALKDIGVDIITTAGNHCLDKGFKGLSETIDVLDQNGIEHLGTYKTEEDQKKLFVKDINGAKVAFIDYTYGTNGIPIPSGKEFCVNVIDKEKIKAEIEKAKEEKVDVIIACMHWGEEYHTKPVQAQEDLADFLFQNGVDIIIGNHPHVIEPFETREVKMPDGTTKQCFVAYALGNFTADQRAVNTRDSIIINLKVTKKADGKVSIDNVDYIPLYIYKNPSLSLKKFVIIDLKKAIENYENGTDKTIGSTAYNLFKTELSQIEKIVEK